MDASPLCEKLPNIPIAANPIGTAPTIKSIFCKDVLESLKKHQIAKLIQKRKRDEIIA
jgi:hypothetical protein